MKIDGNSVTKGEIAHYKQFRLLPKGVQNSSAAEASESVYMWEKENRSKPWYNITADIEI